MIFLYATALAIGYVFVAIQFTRRKFQRKNIVLSRIGFASYTFYVSQICFLVAVGALLLGTFGFSLFVAPDLALANVLASIIAFAVAPLMYGSRVKAFYDSHGQGVAPKSVSATIVVGQIIVAVALLSGLFYAFNGISVVRQLVGEFAVMTGRGDLVETLEFEFQKRNAHEEIARTTQDVTLCDKLQIPRDKARCYEESDPEYMQYYSTCALYTKHGDLDSSYESQARCITEQFIYAPFKEHGPINCADIAQNFAENKYLNKTLNRCRALETLQYIIDSREPARCSGYLERPLSNQYMAKAYMACIGNFMGSSEWTEACRVYGSSSVRPYELMALAKCTGYEQYAHLGDLDDVINVFESIPAYREPFSE